VIASPNLDHPFWTFSLAVYGAPGVADECLALQERLQLDVNLMLFVAYAGAVEGVRLDAAEIAAAAGMVATWQGDVVRALRQARRALKPFSLDAADPLHAQNATLRASVQAAELQAEKLEQAMLWAWSRQRFAACPRDNPGQALTGNLRALLEFYGLPDDQAEPALILPLLFDAAMAYGSNRTSP
jgi:uncharacterized protein (TIGR02444 family)